MATHNFSDRRVPSCERDVEIMLGLKSAPLFESEDGHQIFRENFSEQVAPSLEQCRLARARSDRDSQNRIVN